jgi:hypothetical protein
MVSQSNAAINAVNLANAMTAFNPDNTLDRIAIKVKKQSLVSKAIHPSGGLQMPEATSNKPRSLRGCSLNQPRPQFRVCTPPAPH